MNFSVKLALGVTTVATIGAVMPPFTNQSGSGRVHAAVTVQTDGCVKNPVASQTSIQTNDQKCAWEFFAAIVHPTDKTNPDPDWTKWSDKCDAGLTNNSCDETAEPALQDAAVLKADRLAMRVPVQVELEAETQANVKSKKSVDAPQLASVLFNPQAKAYLQGNGTNGLGNAANLDKVLSNLDPSATSWKARQLTPPDPGAGTQHPVALKLIWEVVYDRQPLIHLYDGEPQLESEYADKSSGTSAKLLSATQWPVYMVDDSLRDCNPTGPPELASPDKEAPHISASCFYSIHIDLSQPDVRKQLIGDGKQAINGPNFEHEPARAFLVGFHSMELTLEHPLWNWMTFYWTRQMNGHPNWVSKWQHFQVKSTTTEGTDESTIHSSGPVYNPYLEGQTSLYGTNTNCLSCHNLAAYTPGGTSGNLTKANLYTHQANVNNASLAAVEKNATDHQYFQNALRTSFLWSIATNQLPPPQPQTPTASAGLR